MFHLLLPKHRLTATEHYRNLPMFFLAGPILGGGDWQAKMSALLAERIGDCIIVNPSRYTEQHPQYKYGIGGSGAYRTQTEWERFYLAEAGGRWPAGCIIFWLPEQKEPRTDGAPYAMDTRGEIGEWRGRLMAFGHQVRMVMGAEPGFPGLKTITKNFDLAIGPSFKTHYSMDAVIAEAALYADKTKSFEHRLQK